MLEKAQDFLQQVYEQTLQVLEELQAVAKLTEEELLVVGCSSSEVIGQRIGTSGSVDVAKQIVQAVLSASKQHGFQVAFQCCEHLNRALVVEKKTRRAFGLEEVTVVPVRQAGGAMAATAYRTLTEPVMVERIQAHAGVDIGDTFIGMHLRPVVVPVRPSIREIGAAHVTMAYTRPKLIGGARAIYVFDSTQSNEQ